MDLSLTTQVAIALGTWALVLITWRLVKKQLSAAKEQFNEQSTIAKEHVKVQLYLVEIRKEFDGDRLVSARKRLAQQLLRDPSSGDLQEDVMNFFEDMGMLFRRGYLDREMIWDTFGYYARMWWSACKDYIAEERVQDETFFTTLGCLLSRFAYR